MQREPGFYWVKADVPWSNRWEIGHYGLPSQWWHLVEDPDPDAVYTDAQVIQVGPRITPPEEKE